MKKINFILLLFLFYGCENINKDSMSSVRIDKQLFGETVDGIKIHEYTLKNKSGMEISIIEYGGIITSWKAGDREGVYEDVVLGFDNLRDYENKSPYFGALIGRYGNRIADGKFSIENKNYIGDLAISLEKIIFESNKYKIKKNKYLSQITIHGILHLLGYDHINDDDYEIMNKIEDRIIKELYCN